MQKTIHLSLENDHDDDNDAHDVMLVVIKGFQVPIGRTLWVSSAHAVPVRHLPWAWALIIMTIIIMMTMMMIDDGGDNALNNSK